MSSSYKPVMLLAILDHVDDRGRARSMPWSRHSTRSTSTGSARAWPSSDPGCGWPRRIDLSHEDVRALMLGMPFRKFEQRKYLAYDRQDLAYLRFPPALWRQLTDEDRATVRGHCERAISAYYERLEP